MKIRALAGLAIGLFPAMASADPVYLTCGEGTPRFTVTLDESAGRAVHVDGEGKTHKVSAAFSAEKVVYVYVVNFGDIGLKTEITISRIDLTAERVDQIEGGNPLSPVHLQCALSDLPKRKF